MFELSELTRVKYAEQIEVREMLQSIIILTEKCGYELKNEPFIGDNEKTIMIELRKTPSAKTGDIIEV